MRRLRRAKLICISCLPSPLAHAICPVCVAPRYAWWVPRCRARLTLAGFWQRQPLPSKTACMRQLRPAGFRSWIARCDVQASFDPSCCDQL
eukprot:1194909-Prorocentrum_minimum.AAC.8